MKSKKKSEDRTKRRTHMDEKNNKLYSNERDRTEDRQ